MENPNKLSQYIKTQAADLGFVACGIAQARRLDEEAPALERYLSQNYHGQMHYMANHFEKRLDPRELVPGAKSVISLIYNYFTNEKQSDPQAPRLAKYAYGEDYHTVVKDKLAELIIRIREKVGHVEGRAFVDSAPVLERAWARLAGIGWQGKNGNLINRQAGSFFFIAELIIDLPLDYDSPFQTNHCGQCTRCIDACPTQAIVSAGVVDGSRCISYLTIELREAIPLAMKGLFQNRVFGCDICQDVCPWNSKVKQHNELRFRPKPELMQLSATQWHELTQEVFGKLFSKSAVKRTKFEGLKRNLDFLK